MKFSIIIPAYNVAPYIARCLDSVIADDYPDKEIIIVDDGSKDDLSAVVNPYTQKYSWIKFYKQENSGQSVARNFALRQATGDYIVFVDADDFWVEAPLKKFAECFSEFNVDIIRTSYICTAGIIPPRQEEKSNWISKKDPGLFYKRLSSEDFFEKIRKNRCFDVVPVAGAFKKEFLIKNKIEFREHLKFEDHEFNMRCYLFGATFCMLPIRHYAYFMREGSTTKSPTIDSIVDIAFNARVMKKSIENEKERLGKFTSELGKTVSIMTYHGIFFWTQLSFLKAMSIRGIFTKDLLSYSKRHPWGLNKKIDFALKIFSLSPILTWAIFNVRGVTHLLKKKNA